MQLDFEPGLKRKIALRSGHVPWQAGSREAGTNLDRERITFGSFPPFYERVNKLLGKDGFDAFAGDLPKVLFPHRTAGTGSGTLFSSVAGGIFRTNRFGKGHRLAGSDSLALRRFLGYRLDEETPDHTTISRTRRLIDVETHRQVFGWVLKMLGQEGLLNGNTIAIDGTTLEANAALRSIVRRDSSEGYDEFLKRVAKQSGIETPTREQWAKLDRKRPRKGSNEEWVNPHDPDARITRMKDGCTHLAHKAEDAVDLETGAIV